VTKERITKECEEKISQLKKDLNSILLDEKAIIEEKSMEEIADAKVK
jgi:hypothetical protein